MDGRDVAAIVAVGGSVAMAGAVVAGSIPRKGVPFTRLGIGLAALVLLFRGGAWGFAGFLVVLVAGITVGWTFWRPLGPRRAQRPWPERYAVTLDLSDGTTWERTAVSWVDEAAAVAIARRAYEHLDGTAEVVRGRAVGLGRAPQAEDGTIAVGDDLFDRNEF